MKRHPNLRHLAFFVALAEVGHFRKAADACNVSQSTLSAGIAELEGLLGVKLAERDRRSVLLTPEGRRLLDQARKVLTEADTLAALAEAAADPFVGRVELGCVPSIGPFLLPRFLPFARERLPGLVFGLREDKTPALVERLGDGRLDLLLLAFPYPLEGFATEMVFEDHFRFACPADHPLAGAALIGDDDLVGEPLMLMERDNCLHAHALPVLGAMSPLADTVYSATGLHTLVAMVAEGLGTTLLPELALSAGLVADHKVATVPLEGGANHRTVGLAWRRGTFREPAYRALADLLRAWIAARRQA